MFRILIRVCGSEILSEEGLGSIGMPECFWECEIDLFEATVPNMFNGFGNVGWKRRREGGEIPFEPAKGASQDYLVKFGEGTVSRGDGK